MYDGTAFLKDHPGGAESILLAAGMDSSDDFNAIHSAKAKKMVEDYYIGEFDDSAPSMALTYKFDACIGDNNVHASVSLQVCRTSCIGL